MEENIRKNIIFSGRVQGVGFRYTAYTLAQAIGLTGWVKNLYDGTVEMEIQGMETEIDRLVLSLDRGNYIEILGMEVKRKSLQENEKDFRILN